MREPDVKLRQAELVLSARRADVQLPRAEADQLRAEIERRFPAEGPVGSADLVVLIDDRPSEERAGEKSVLGLFADDAEMVDEALAYVRERRKNYRTGPA